MALIRGEIRTLLSEVRKLSDLATELTQLCVDVFVNKRKVDGLVSLVEERSNVISFSYMELKEKVSQVIARYQPMAEDLRTLISIMEIGYGLNRLGRYSRNIAQVLESFHELEECDTSVVIKPAETLNKMVEMALKAYESGDSSLAREVISMDDLVDGAYNSYMSKIIKGEERNPKCAVANTLILRYLERMADHAVQIAEETIYMVEGTYFARS